MNVFRFTPMTVRLAAACVLTVTALAALPPASAAETKAPAAAAGAFPLRKAPVLKLPDLKGAPQDLAQWRGRPVLLNYWATWCGPCLKELPELEHFAQAQGKTAKGIALVGVAQDEASAANALQARLKLSYPQLVEADGPPGSAAAFGNPGGTLPFSVLIDAQGNILDTHNGPLDAAGLARWAKLAGVAP